MPFRWMKWNNFSPIDKEDIEKLRTNVESSIYQFSVWMFDVILK